MTNTETLPQSHPLVLMLKASDEIAMWERILRDSVVRARGDGISWADIATTLGVSKQAAQQRFAKDVPPEFKEPWMKVTSNGELVHWARHRTDRSYCIVAQVDDGWRWAHRGPERDPDDQTTIIHMTGLAKTAAAAKKAVEAYLAKTG